MSKLDHKNQNYRGTEYARPQTFCRNRLCRWILQLFESGCGC